MRKHPLVVVLVNVLVFCVAAEALALVIFYYQHGWLFYIDPYRTTYAVIPETRGGQLTLEGLHPYFGPTHKPGVPFDVPMKAMKWDAGPGEPASYRVPDVATNNFGFTSRYDYPFIKKNDNQFVVGIFGGSVGDWFCQLGAVRMVERLQENRFFGSREIIPICLSHQGYKQPQQLLVLAYFLSIGQPLDLVINISGFNEVALASMDEERGFDISMPSPVHVDPLVNLVNQATMTPEKLETLADINRLKQRLNRLADRLNRTRLASVSVALEQAYAITSKEYQAALLRFDRLPSIPSEHSLIHITPRVRLRTRRAVFEDIAKNWVSSSMLMNAMLTHRGVPYFDFLQPNQYYSQRRFTGDEAAVALTGESPFKRSVEGGYPVLEREMQSNDVKDAHLHLTNATRIFDTAPSPVYIDNCCHYTLPGNQILADFIAATILNSEGPWK